MEYNNFISIEIVHEQSEAKIILKGLFFSRKTNPQNQAQTKNRSQWNSQLNQHVDGPDEDQGL